MQVLAHVELTLSLEHFEIRSAAGRRLCQKFGFVDSRDRLQLSECLKALNNLAAADRIVLLTPQCAVPLSRPIVLTKLHGDAESSRVPPTSQESATIEQFGRKKPLVPWAIPSGYACNFRI